MNLAYTMQKFQDWFTQQWVILWGRKFDPTETQWLIGPFGNLDGIGELFIDQLAEQEGLCISRNTQSTGLVKSINQLGLSDTDLKKLSAKVIDFYEKTSDYELKLHVKWYACFRLFGYVVNRLFSKRINQLNIPLKNNKQANISSEIIELIDSNNKAVYTIWLRKIVSTGQVVYSGIYSTCALPSGTTCIKAIFPLPKGNATVLLKPSVGNERELILHSQGKAFGDAGFYFLLNDAKNKYWAQFISSFTDKLIVKEVGDNLEAKQTLKLWGMRVVEFTYQISKRGI